VTKLKRSQENEDDADDGESAAELGVQEVPPAEQEHRDSEAPPDRDRDDPPNRRVPGLRILPIDPSPRLQRCGREEAGRGDEEEHVADGDGLGKVESTQCVGDLVRGQREKQDERREQDDDEDGRALLMEGLGQPGPGDLGLASRDELAGEHPEHEKDDHELRQAERGHGSRRPEAVGRIRPSGGDSQPERKDERPQDPEHPVRKGGVGVRRLQLDEEVVASSPQHDQDQGGRNQADGDGRRDPFRGKPGAEVLRAPVGDDRRRPFGPEVRGQPVGGDCDLDEPVRPEVDEAEGRGEQHHDARTDTCFR
jgi:hypothetical protein